MEQLIITHDNKPCTTSRMIAAKFGKRHADLLRSIESLECGEDFRERNFALSSYLNDQNKQQPEYIITRDGFVFLVMGFTGKQAAKFKEQYINAFNEAHEELAKAIPAISRAEMLVQQAEVLLEQERRIDAIQKQLAAKETHVTILGYCNMKHIKANKYRAMNLGLKVSNYCRINNHPIHKVYNEMFGEVNSYPIEVLNKLYESGFLD